ncbi:glycosyltransferase [Candidatus Woesearchaeota archaeon]|nr:glycosyltransferase [Candidatus Woesearchaeota archaeon]
MKVNMKVLVFASSAFPRWPDDPAPAFVYDLSKHLQQKGMEVVALVPHHPGAKRFETASGIRTYRFRYFLPGSLERLCYDAGILPNLKKSFLARLQLPIFVAAEFFSLWKAAKKEKPDIIHAHWILPQGFTAAIVSKILRIPVVVTAHAGDVFPLKSFLFRLLSGFSTRSAAAVTVNSSYTRAAVAKISKLGDIKVIPMGVDLKLFSSASSSAAAIVRKKYGISENGRMLLFVGRLAEKKGVTYMIAAMKAVVKAFPDCRLVIVGEGPEKASLQQQVQRLSLSGSVVFAGSIPNISLPSFYKAADVFVLPSIVDRSGDTEGLGVVLLEAIAAGTPVVASNVGGIPDIVAHSKTGLLVEQKSPHQLAAAIIKLLGSSSLRKRLSVSARKRVTQGFSWSGVAGSFYSLYRSVLSRTSRTKTF